MSIATTLIAPAGVTLPSTATGISGASYAVDANGFVTITTQGDILPFLNAGYRQASAVLASQAIGANGLTATPLRLLEARAPTGAALAASASAGVLGYAVTLGTSFALVSEAANNSTKADSAIFEFVLPPTYVAGQNVTVTANASITIGSGTLTTKTLGVTAYRTDKAGAQGGNICSTSPAALSSNAATDYAFTIAGATLNPGDRLVIQPTLTITETSSHNVTANVNSVRIT